MAQSFVILIRILEAIVQTDSGYKKNEHKTFTEINFVLLWPSDIMNKISLKSLFPFQ